MEKGWFLAFDPSFLDEDLKSTLDQCLSEIILVKLSSLQSDSLSLLAQHLYSVYNNTSQLFHESVVQSLIKAFIYEVASAYLSLEKSQTVRHSSRSVAITKTFKQLLRQHYRELKKPAEYADKINVSVNHLNTTVKLVTGFSVTYYIQQELMREAQRLLYHTKMSIKEVALELGFEDDKYFMRLFSKVIGLSAGTFRKMKNSK